MKVEVDVNEWVFDTETGPRTGLEVTCLRCGHSVEVYGRSSAAALAGAWKLRAECQRGEDNFYDMPEWVKQNL